MGLAIPSATNLSLFISATLVLLLVPGPAVLYIFARSVAQGRSAGLVSIFGIHTATLVHVAAAAVGLSALLASSALAFNIVKYAGAAYLIWLGLKKLVGPSDIPNVEGGLPPRSRMRLFCEGFLVNLLNPKTALFFLAFLPQFVEVNRGHVATQIAFLGLVYTAIGVLTDSSYALAAGTAGRWLKRSPMYLKAERWVSGFVYVGLGLTAAFAGNQKK
ncbi:LysE family translocator [Sphingobium sp. BYY-5]|uniref:LysE family translocator n=1 Tax=Sphingobium sp. BYY-5 TaxID=2926400 RepID=UPI001FA741F4|nr:LysE family translocator [Sphingobium sp. BYY-5]MCI4592257.1 LysE family translocator [Sphingobium sp. BYY-5]